MSRDLWARQYLTDAIPTSTKTRPSHGVRYLLQAHAQGMVPGGRLLDLGCGGDRNAAALGEAGFEVCGLDFVHGPLAAARSAGSSAHLVEASMTACLPFIDRAFSTVTAFTSVENVVEDAQIRSLGREIHRVLRPYGTVLLYFLCPDDQYYRRLIRRQPDDRFLSFDPATKLRQRLYTVNELSRLLGESFRLCDSADFVFPDTRSGKRYSRHLSAGIWARV